MKFYMFVYGFLSLLPSNCFASGRWGHAKDNLEWWQSKSVLESETKSRCADAPLPNCAWDYIEPTASATHLCAHPLGHMPISFPCGQCFEAELVRCGCRLCFGQFLKRMSVIVLQPRRCDRMWPHPLFLSPPALFSSPKCTCLCACFVYYALMPLRNLNLEVLNIRQVFHHFTWETNSRNNKTHY